MTNVLIDTARLLANIALKPESMPGSMRALFAGSVCVERNTISASDRIRRVEYHKTERMESHTVFSAG